MNSFDFGSIISMLQNLNAGVDGDVLRNIEVIMKQFSDYLPCIELNRFEALQSESELVERAKELHRNRMVIAGRERNIFFFYFSFIMFLFRHCLFEFE